jgi:cysteine desulfurase
MIYADYNGSAPVCDDVRNYLADRLATGPFANPNAIHYLGQKTLTAMENARAFCAKALGAKPKQLTFNSGATEGLSQAFFSTLIKAKDTERKTIIISGIEHSAIVNLAQHYEKYFNFTVRILPTTSEGIIDLTTLDSWIKEEHKKIALVSIMAANNETGVIQPYKDISKLCRDHAITYVCDTTQLIGKGDFNFEESGADFAVLSGHKIGALTGTGILMTREPQHLCPLIIGGGQERGARGGTQNYLGNETLAVALDYFQKNKAKLAALREARDAFEAQIKRELPGLVILGEGAPRLASTTYLSYPGIHGQAVQIELESQDIYVTTSSACSDNEPTTSKVLKAMKVSDDVGRGAVRISLGPCSPQSSYQNVAEALIKACRKLGKIKSF